ncbi:hypothetical protein BH10ACI4_BH10ACI4_03670 [soil metagenome]
MKKLSARCALTPGGRHFVVYWTLRVKDSTLGFSEEQVHKDRSSE